MEDDSKIYRNENFGEFMFSCNEMGIFRKDLNKINLDDSNQNVDSENTIYVALLELMFVA